MYRLTILLATLLSLLLVHEVRAQGPREEINLASSPELYVAEVTLAENREVLDVYQQTFGFREFWADGKRAILRRDGKVDAIADSSLPKHEVSHVRFGVAGGKQYYFNGTLHQVVIRRLGAR